MKKNFFLLLILTSCLTLFAYDRPSGSYGKPIRQEPEKEEEQKKENDYLFEVKPSYFYFHDNTARDLYNKGGFMISLEFHGRIYENLFWFSELGFLYKDGHDYNLDTDTDIFLMPLSFGLKGIYSINNFIQLYAKIAPNWVWVTTWDDYPFFDSSKSRSTFGASFGIGAIFFPVENCAIDLFVGFLYDKKTFKDKAQNIKFSRYFGGMPFGIGLGYSF